MLPPQSKLRDATHRFGWRFSPGLCWEDDEAEEKRLPRADGRCNGYDHGGDSHGAIHGGNGKCKHGCDRRAAAHGGNATREHGCNRRAAGQGGSVVGMEVVLEKNNNGWRRDCVVVAMVA